MKKYKLAVYIGRFQPFHMGHAHVVEQAMTIADNVMIMVGSSNQARSYKNPFTFDEREEMILDFVLESKIPSTGYIWCEPLENTIYNNDRWIARVQEILHRTEYKDSEIVIVGHHKDASSSYIDWFPQYDKFEVGNFGSIDATRIRTSYFSNIGHMFVKDLDGHKEGDLEQDKFVPTSTKNFLEDFIKTPYYKNICDEADAITKYKLPYINLKFPPIFVAVDACVIQFGHILLIERGQAPGKGLLALPGGYLNANETIEQGFLRELREETGLKIPEKVLLGSIKKVRVFDDPNRDERGRMITHAHFVKLDDSIELPRVRGDDDAAKAFWKPLADLRREDFFADHFCMIDDLINLRK